MASDFISNDGHLLHLAAIFLDTAMSCNLVCFSELYIWNRLNLSPWFPIEFGLKISDHKLCSLLPFQIVAICCVLDCRSFLGMRRKQQTIIGSNQCSNQLVCSLSENYWNPSVNTGALTRWTSGACKFILTQIRSIITGIGTEYSGWNGTGSPITFLCN